MGLEFCLSVAGRIYPGSTSTWANPSRRDNGTKSAAKGPPLAPYRPRAPSTKRWSGRAITSRVKAAGRSDQPFLDGQACVQCECGGCGVGFFPVVPQLTRGCHSPAHACTSAAISTAYYANMCTLNLNDERPMKKVGTRLHHSERSRVQCLTHCMRGQYPRVAKSVLTEIRRECEER